MTTAHEAGPEEVTAIEVAPEVAQDVGHAIARRQKWGYPIVLAGAVLGVGLWSWGRAMAHPGMSVFGILIALSAVSGWRFLLKRQWRGEAIAKYAFDETVTWTYDGTTLKGRDGLGFRSDLIARVPRAIARRLRALPEARVVMRDKP